MTIATNINNYGPYGVFVVTATVLHFTENKKVALFVGLIVSLGWAILRIEGPWTGERLFNIIVCTAETFLAALGSSNIISKLGKRNLGSSVIGSSGTVKSAGFLSNWL